MAAWNQTPEGSHLNQAWAQMQYAYTTAIPTHIQSLRNLSTRPIDR